MSDFEQQFLSQISTSPAPQTTSVAPTSAPKKPFNKKWLVLGSLVLLLVGIIIALNIIQSGKQPDADFVLTLDRTQPLTDSVVGRWRCASPIGFSGDETESTSPNNIGDPDQVTFGATTISQLSFSNNSTYIFSYWNGDVEGGTFTQIGNRLTLRMLSLRFDDTLRDDLESERSYELFATTSGKMALMGGDGDTEAGVDALTISYVCE